MDQPILSISGVSKHFGGLRALDDISFNLPAGEIMGLMGPNGAGKTTLVNVICGFYKPDAGKIKFKGEDVTGSPPHKVCHLGIARTYQIPQPFGDLTAQQNVAVAAMFGKRIGKATAEKEALEVLETTDLLGRKDMFAKDMSTVTLKRLEVARALAMDPTLLLVDEVAAGLNETELPRMMEILAAIRQKGVTIILIEHVMKIMRDAVDTILVLNEGTTIAFGKPDAVMKDEKVIQCYLGESYKQ
ncbi:MAG: ABC transporter ATP-binding protein [Chloroflexi bacterium]|nr:ABC transporter ATP-binding protein [Chloroflexota bacterium]